MRAHSGIELTRHKHALVEARVFRHLVASGSDAKTYIQQVLSSEDPRVRQQFLELITTHETHFFRESHHFHILEQEVKRWTGSRFFVWCAAASTGQEAYSIALTLARAEQQGGSRPEARVWATDLSQRVLQQAEQGRYAWAEVAKLPPPLRDLGFRVEPGQTQTYRVRAEIRRRIRFEAANLIDPSLAAPVPMNAIFCRNVLIYFDRSTRERVLRRLVQALAPNGLLFLGNAESPGDLALPLDMVGPTAYRKR